MLPTTLCEWERGAEPLAAGVSSFGFGGTNAHVVLEEYLVPPRLVAAESRERVLAFSARSPSALAMLATAHEGCLRDLPDELLGDYVHTATARRSHAGYRVAVTGRSPASLADALRSRLQAGLADAMAADPRGTGVVFVFTGQGSQWAGMGRELFDQAPVFREAVSAVAAIFDRHAGWSLLEVLRDPAHESRLAATDVAQPAIFAMQVGLTALWRSWGVQPAAIIGHSVGEVAAAHAAGVLTLEEAVLVVLHRGRLMQPTAGRGRMAQVELPPAELAADLAPFSAAIERA
ncbi:MAG: Malonyl CoA-acyl carrier protein transacylase, partial [Gemmatimonadetes bacterium]|nr:Malonyl CoA-acyl carrier protein transacylase [Gemmatimonadota bacterium]